MSCVEFFKCHRTPGVRRRSHASRSPLRRQPRHLVFAAQSRPGAQAGETRTPRAVARGGVARLDGRRLSPTIPMGRDEEGPMDVSA